MVVLSATKAEIREFRDAVMSGAAYLAGEGQLDREAVAGLSRKLERAAAAIGEPTVDMELTVEEYRVAEACVETAVDRDALPEERGDRILALCRRAEFLPAPRP